MRSVAAQPRATTGRRTAFYALNAEAGAVEARALRCGPSGNDWQTDRQFRALNAEAGVVEVKALRSGRECLVTNTDVVVGDVLLLDTGDRVVADGIAVETHGLTIDEASLTGESEPIRKELNGDMFCKSGTEVTEGSGRMLVLAVGERSKWGRTMAMVASEPARTPLQVALGVLAAKIGKVGLAVGTLCFVVLTVRWCIREQGFPLDKIKEGPLRFFIYAVTIVVVAVPEGLPLAVTMSLVYSMRKMMKDANFVRVLAACETMGGATTICSDKTGTLTENRMTVVAGWFAGRAWDAPPALKQLPPALASALQVNIALNSKAFLVEHNKDTVDFVGNRTDCALLMLLRAWGTSYEALREARHDDVEEIYTFSSERKMASVLLREANGLMLYNKGAVEIVLANCTALVDSNAADQPLSNAVRADLQAHITSMAASGLRTLCLAQRRFPGARGDHAPGVFDQPPEEQLTLCCIVGIKDPVRKEVPQAVATCQRAGIMVRMVTGDNLHTARHIAAECGIFTEGGLVLEGPNFRARLEAELLALLPRLQVLPAAPKLIPGEYGPPSPCLAYWSVEDVDRSALGLQGGGGSVNVCCDVAASGECISNLQPGGLYRPGEIPICALSGGSCLRINPQSSLAGAACRGAPNPSSCPRFQALSQAQDQAAIQQKDQEEFEARAVGSLVFNTFVFMQVFNMLNSRKLKDELNVFSGILASHMYHSVWGVIVVLQVLIMLTPVRVIFHCVEQDGYEWLFAITAGAGSLLVALATKLATWLVNRCHAERRSSETSLNAPSVSSNNREQH